VTRPAAGRDAVAPAGHRPRPLLRTVVGDALRRVRLHQGRTLADVSNAARVSMPYLSELERGRKEASSEVLAAIYQALGLDLDDLLAIVGRELAAQRRRGGRVVRLDAIRQQRGRAASSESSAGAEPSPTPAPAAAPAQGGQPAPTEAAARGDASRPAEVPARGDTSLGAEVPAPGDATAAAGAQALGDGFPAIEAPPDADTQALGDRFAVEAPAEADTQALGYGLPAIEAPAEAGQPGLADASVPAGAVPLAGRLRHLPRRRRADNVNCRLAA
jgi:transcriptional regulator with XRE-family HTH domain